MPTIFQSNYVIGNKSNNYYAGSVLVMSYKTFKKQCSESLEKIQIIFKFRTIFIYFISENVILETNNDIGYNLYKLITMR